MTEQKLEAILSEILERLIRIETRQCKLMAKQGVEPSARDGYSKEFRDYQSPVHYWESRK